MEMKNVLLNILILSSLDFVLGSVVRQGHTYFDYSGTWEEAQQECSTLHIDGDWTLLSHQDEVEHVHTTQVYSRTVWIGLMEENDKAEWVDETLYDRDGHSNNYKQCAYVTTPYENFTGTFSFIGCWKRKYFYCAGRTYQAPVTFLPYAVNWETARRHCRRYYDDLVVLKEKEQYDNLPKPDITYIWTGIRRDGPDGDWSPNSGIGKPIYADWAEGQPTSDGDCVGLSLKDKKLANIDCSFSLSFYCFQDNLVLVKENKTWEEALEFCNAMQWEDPSLQYYDYININLISYSDLDHYTMWSTIQEAKTDEVWTGLRYLAHQWFWVDGTDLQYEDLPQCPDLGQHCGTLDRDNITIPWRISDCTEKRNFLCYRGQPGFYPHHNG